MSGVNRITITTGVTYIEHILKIRDMQSQQVNHEQSISAFSPVRYANSELVSWTM